MKKTVATETWPLEVKSGSAVVKTYRAPKASGCVSCAAVYYKGSERKARFFQKLTDAKSAAKKIADAITQPAAFAPNTPAFEPVFPTDGAFNRDAGDF